MEGGREPYKTHQNPYFFPCYILTVVNNLVLNLEVESGQNQLTLSVNYPVRLDFADEEKT